MYRGGNKGLYVLLSRSQAGPGRTVKQEQEEISRNCVQTFISPSVDIPKFGLFAADFLALLRLHIAKLGIFYRLSGHSHSNLKRTHTRKTRLQFTSGPIVELSGVVGPSWPIFQAATLPLYRGHGGRHAVAPAHHRHRPAQSWYTIRTHDTNNPLSHSNQQWVPKRTSLVVFRLLLNNWFFAHISNLISCATIKNCLTSLILPLPPN